MMLQAIAYPGIFFEGGGVQQIRLRTEDRENGDLGGSSLFCTFLNIVSKLRHRRVTNTISLMNVFIQH